MNPERLAEPRALAVMFTALIFVAALLVFTVGGGETHPRPAHRRLIAVTG
jgi:hypothetical protein